MKAVLPLPSLLILAALVSESEAAIGLSYAVPYTQNFDSLASSGTSSTLPADWVFAESGSNANTTYAAGTGSDNGGNTYSFGSASSSERALGGLLSSSLTPSFGTSFSNDTGYTTIYLNVAYVGEQWRLGATAREDRLQFEYSTNATSITTGTWTAATALNFVAPTTSGTVGALNGNLTANQSSISSWIGPVSVPINGTFWIRWTDFNASGADDGLAIDNFSITAVPEPSIALLGGLGLLGLVRRRR